MPDQETIERAVRQSQHSLDQIIINTKNDFASFGEMVRTSGLSNDQLELQLERLERRMDVRLNGVNLLRRHRDEFREFVNGKRTVCEEFRQYLNDHKL